MMTELNDADYARILAKAKIHAHDNIFKVVQHDLSHQALIIHDEQCTLSTLVGQAYASVLPQSPDLHFDQTTPEACMEALNQLQKGDLVILVQSSSFRLDAFRIRVQLFQRGVKVIEHPHLNPMSTDQIEIYVDAMAVESQYWSEVGRGLQARVQQAPFGRIYGADWEMRIDGPFEEAKLNIGDFSERKNIGGQFPIGEVFTEALDLQSVHGQAAVFAYGDAEFRCQFLEQPCLLQIEAGRVVGALNSTPDFDAVLAEIAAEEECIWVREIGFGLNRALTRTRRLTGIGSYERLCGIHLSLGAKHLIYDKAQFRKRKTKFHVDVFLDALGMDLGTERVYSPGSWLGSEVLFPWNS